MSESAFYLAIGGWVVTSLVFGILLMRVRAPYGRYSRPGWGPTVSHRLGWFLMELPALTVFATVLVSGSRDLSWPLWVFLLLWEVHYVNRTIVFPLRMDRGSKRMPLSIVGSAVVFNFVNGWLNGYYLGALGPTYDVSWFFEARFIVGLFLFVVGMMINVKSDAVLLRLRRSGSYRMPEGGLFDFVSCPNYLGEIIEWTGFAVLTWSPAAAAFAIWTAANLIPRAISNDEWYRNRFDDYPVERRAIIPGVL